MYDNPAYTPQGQFAPSVSIPPDMYIHVYDLSSMKCSEIRQHNTTETQSNSPNIYVHVHVERVSNLRTTPGSQGWASSVLLLLCFTSQNSKFLLTGYFSHILHLDIIKSEINFKLKVKMHKILIYGFQWG